jgi:hypothetical protein
MQPSRRYRILAYVGHQNALPPGTTAPDAQELRGLIVQLDELTRWRLTQAGWRELERLSQLSPN